ncbi:DMT family transporter [uncultured Serratia sp.]|uniref:DMT family transporter n=1 Tax=uncultured Serratia sp. TaxID=239175 RepID=UPI0025872777|nr:DMT family transporter [uncultured Serratia sp.]
MYCSVFFPLALAAWRAKVLTRDQIRHLPHFAIMSVLATTFYYYGFVAGTARLPSSVAGLLSGSIPIFTFICAFLFLKQDRPTVQMAVGVVLGFVGIALSARPWEGTDGVALVGIFWMLAGALSLGVSFVYAQGFLSSLKVPPLALATWQTGFALLTLLILTDFDGMYAITTNTRALLGACVGLGMLGTGGAFFCYYYIIEKLGSVKAAGATYIAPVVAVLIGVAVGEDINSTVILSLALILGSVILIQRGKRSTTSTRRTSASG